MYRRRLAILAAAVGSTLACAGGGPVVPQPTPDPGEDPANWLLIVADSVGTHDVSAYPESDDVRTPNLDQLAAEGLLFRNAYASPASDAGHAALLSGRTSAHTGLGGTRSPGWALPTDQALLPEVLASALESRVFVGRWRLADDPADATEQGFEQAHADVQQVEGALRDLGDAPWLLVVALEPEGTDDAVGHILAALTPAQRQGTQVVFVGASGARSPDPMAEAAIGVPLIVSGPDVERGETDALVHVIDLLPTLADALGVEVESSGVSFLEVLGDPRGSGSRQFVYAEHLEPAGAARPQVDWRALRDDRYKITRERRGDLTAFDLSDRHDDGPGAAPASLRGQERVRFERLRDTLERTVTTGQPPR